MKPVVEMKVKPVFWIRVKLFVQMELDSVVFFPEVLKIQILCGKIFRILMLILNFN